MLTIKLNTAPTEEPVTVDEAKAQCRVDISDDDALIGSYITVARQWAESFRRQKFITQTWELYLDAFPGGGMLLRLPFGPVQSVSEIAYKADGESTYTAVSSSNYVVDAISEPARIVLATNGSWPGDALVPVNGVKITFVCGYGLATAVPESIQQAIKLIVGHLYENREDVVIAQGISVSQVPMAAKALLWPERVLSF